MPVRRFASSGMSQMGTYRIGKTTGGGDCKTGQFFGPSGVKAVFSSTDFQSVRKLDQIFLNYMGLDRVSPIPINQGWARPDILASESE